MKQLTVLAMVPMVVLGACTAKKTAAPSATSTPAASSPTAMMPARWAAEVTNPWYPLHPGAVYTYKGSEDGEQLTDILKVTSKKKTIQGVSATVVDDRVYKNGILVEKTKDWYAQDAKGNVWYLGEATAELDRNGKVTSTEGSWESGKNGASAGIFMPAKPTVGFSSYQEYDKGHAEDRFKIVSLTEKVTTPAVSSNEALLTQETTRLEPGVLDHKTYVKGYGTVVEKTVKGGSELLILQSVTGRG
jgi:hypothetical protein